MKLPMRRGAKAIALCLAFTAVLTAADLWTKQWAVDNLPCQVGETANCRAIPGRHFSRAGGILLVDGYLDFTYAENRGAAFGMLNDAPAWVRSTLFTVAATLATGVLMWMFVTASGGVLFAWAVPFIVSGALGNMIDRWRLGYVVDFIRFHLHDGWEWPTFNVADITISIGVGLLLLDGLRKDASIAASNPPTAHKSVSG